MLQAGGQVVENWLLFSHAVGCSHSSLMEPVHKEGYNSNNGYNFQGLQCPLAVVE